MAEQPTDPTPLAARALRPRLAREAPSPPDWRRDALHLVVGSVMGSMIAVLVFRVALQRSEEDLARYQQVRNFVSSSYVEPMDADELLDRALAGMVEGLDPYSAYYDRDAIAGIDRDTTGVYRGIGVVFAPLSPPGQVLFPVEGSPAEEAGIAVGDRIALVEGLEVAELSRDELLRTIAGAGQGGLELQVADRSGALRPVTIVPRELVDPSVRHARLLEAGDEAIGYLALTSFSRRTPGEIDEALAALKALAAPGGLDGLVIDVRGNPGGVLEAAVDLANRFVREGLLVTHEGRHEVVEYVARAELATLAGMPLVVLVDEHSASASEVFAAALQDHRAAVIVGEPTYGKGVVQEVRRFADRMIVKLTTAYYYTPSRRNLERTVDQAWDCGIQPDLLVELEPDEALAVARHLASYTPPPGALEALHAWEQELGVPLAPGHPADAQLEAALGLFQGQRPGAWRVARAPLDGTAPVTAR